MTKPIPRYCRFEKTLNGKLKCSQCGFTMPFINKEVIKQCHSENRYEGISEYSKNDELYSKMGFHIINEPCEHRGTTVREVKCELCGAREKVVPVFNCLKLNASAVEEPYNWKTKMPAISTELVCKRCPHYEPIEETTKSYEEAVQEAERAILEDGRHNWFGTVEESNQKSTLQDQRLSENLLKDSDAN